MSDINNPSNPNHVTVKVPRTALFAGGGLLLVGLGLAAGVMLKSPSKSSVETPAETHALMQSASGVGTQDPLMNQAPAAGLASSTHSKHETHHSHSGSASTGSGQSATTVADVDTRPVATCANCGVIEGVRAVQQKGQGTGLGAVAGGVLGGVVGNQMGKGSGNTAMTVLGAIGGGVAGNEVEKHTRSVTVYEVRVRMDDGSIRTFTQRTEPVPGTRVEVDGHSFHTISASDTRPRTIQTSGTDGV